MFADIWSDIGKAITRAPSNIVKEVVRVGQRTEQKVLRPIVKATQKGDVFKLIMMLNPIGMTALVSQAIGAHKSVADAINATTPVTAFNIQDNRLKEKVLGAYAVAGAVAVAIAAAPALATSSATAGTTATGAVGTAGAVVGTATKATELAAKTGLIKSSSKPQTPTTLTEQAVQQPAEASMFGGGGLPIVIAIVGASVIGLFALAVSKKKKTEVI